MDEDYDYIFKILIIGDISVGKTSIVLKFTDENHELVAPTIGVDLHVKIIEVDDKKVKLQLWEVSGDEKFKYLVSKYYRNCQGLIMMFDLTNKESFENLQSRMNHFKENSLEYCDDIPNILVGNKKDLISLRSVSHEEVLDFASDLNIPYIETSAKTSDNINEVFEKIAREIKMNRKYCLKNMKSFEQKKNSEKKNERSCCLTTNWFTCCF